MRISTSTFSAVVSRGSASDNLFKQGCLLVSRGWRFVEQEIWSDTFATKGMVSPSLFCDLQFDSRHHFCFPRSSNKASNCQHVIADGYCVEVLLYGFEHEGP